MRNAIFTAAFVASVFGLNSHGFAASSMHMPDSFGPVHEMKMHGHKMHMQVIKNKDGETFVVLPKAEAEMMFGAITFDPFLSNSAQGQ